MKRALCLLLAAVCVSSCTTIENWSEREKQTAMIVAGIIVGAVIIAENQGDDIINEIKNECRALPHGVCSP